MKKRQILPVIILTLALLLSVCGAQAFALESAPAETLPDEPYEAVPYRLYPIPEGGYAALKLFAECDRMFRWPMPK